MGCGPIHLRFQRLIPIYFHAMDQNVELQGNIGLSTGRLDSDMPRLHSFNLDRLSNSVLTASALITALLFSFLWTVLFCLLYTKPGLLCMFSSYRYWDRSLVYFHGAVLLLYAQISAIPTSLGWCRPTSESAKKLMVCSTCIKRWWYNMDLGGPVNVAMRKN